MGYKHKASSLSKRLSHIFDVTVKVTGEEVERALALMHGSEEAVEIAIPYANKIAKSIGLKSSVAVQAEAPHKKLLRIFSKAISKHKGDIGCVPDIGRFRILVEKPEDILAIRKLFLGQNPTFHDRQGELLDSHPTNNITIREFEDFYWRPSSTGRVGIHLTLDVKVQGRGIVPVEIQIMHKDMVKTEDFTRDNYESAQLIRRQAMLENREPTAEELEAIEGYDASSRQRYAADCVRLDLLDLRRPDLCSAPAKRAVLKLVA